MSGGGEAVRVEEAAQLRIVIPALEVIQSRLGVVVVAAVADGVGGGQGAGGAEDLAPGVVAVLRRRVPAGVQEHHHIALQVCDVVVPDLRVRPRVPHQQRVGLSALVVEKLRLRAAIALALQSPSTEKGGA